MALGRVIERPSVTDKDHGLSKAPVHHSNTEIRLPPWSHERETEREGERGREEESERRGVCGDRGSHTNVDVAPPALCEQYKETGAQPKY